MQSSSTYDTLLIPDLAAPGMASFRGTADLNVAESARFPTTAAPGLHVRRLAAWEAISSLADGWNRLAGTVPFRRHDWLATWWRHYARPESELCVLAVEDNARRLVGLAPWQIETNASQGRVVRFLGAGEVCSEYLTILAQGGLERQVAQAVGEWLGHEGVESWDLIELIGAQADDPAMGALVEQFRDREHIVHQRLGVNCWSVALPPTWDEFLATLNSSRRAKVRQALRKHFENQQATAHLLTDPAELDRRFAMIVDLHQRRHQGLGQAGCFASPPFMAFHREISRRFLALGKLRLMWTEIAGRPIAAEYDFVDGDTVYYYQTGIEPDAIKVGPGWLGMIGSLKQAIEAGYRNFDFLRGDEAYKISWGAVARPTIERRIVAHRAAARLRHKIWLARTHVRRWMKQSFHLGRKIAHDTD